MFVADPPVRSLDRLAALCLDRERWPESARMQHRSLGAIFGKLDRDENLEWLAGRPEVQTALAEVLGADPDAILSSLKPARGARPGRWVTWDAMPFARGLDLVEEDLFPGLPDEVLHPGGWEKLIWLAPNGAGRSLVGQWLEERGLARHLPSPSLPDELPAARPLLLELGSAEGLDGALPSSRLGTGVCVALPDSTGLDEGPLSAAGWKVVRSKPVRELVEPVAKWARERLATSSRVDVVALAGMLDEAAARGVVQSAGDVLGLVGLTDALGFNAFEFSALRALAREWFKRRVSEKLDRDAPGTGWMRRAGFDALVALCKRVATDARQPLFFPRSLEDWSDLMPAELRHGADLEWLKVALPRADPSLRATDLERASEKLPPGAFRILRTFERLGVLERTGGEELALRPHWLVRAAFEDALESLVAGPAFDWGEALLSPSMAPITAERILVRAREGGLVHEELVDPDVVGDPAYAAATEGALRATGVGVLLGTSPPGESLEALWDEQVRILLELPGALPLPRIDGLGSGATDHGAWLFDRGIWYLATLAVSELLGAHEGRPHPTLRPWQAKAPPGGLPAVLDCIAAALERAETPRELVGPALSLVGRLRALLGPLGKSGAAHRLERAAIVADEAALGVLAWESVVELGTDELALAALAPLCRSRKLDDFAFANAIWNAFAAAQLPLESAGVLLRPELARIVLQHAPGPALVRLAPLLANAPLPLPISEVQWGVLLGGDLAQAPLGLYGAAPASVLDAAVRAAVRDGRPEALETLWRRFPVALSSRVVAAFRAGSADAALSRLLEHAPAAATPELVTALEDVDALLRAPADALTALRRFLHTRVAQRAPGFRETYALFDAIERRCAPVRGAMARGFLADE
jgi:hypothetical protein